MPLYDYRCQACEHQFDEQHKIAEREAPCSLPCPACGAEGQVNLIVGAPALCDPVRLGLRKPTPEFREVMNRMKKGVGRHSHKAIRDF